MKSTKIDLLMIVLLSVSSIAILVGALLKLEHWPYGDIVFKGGFVASFLLSGIEIYRLRKIISKMKK